MSCDGEKRKLFALKRKIRKFRALAFFSLHAHLYNRSNQALHQLLPEQSTTMQRDAMTLKLGRLMQHCLTIIMMINDRHRLNTPLPSNRHHQRNCDCLKGKRENIRSVLCNIVCNNCAQCNAHTWTDLTVLWIGFCLTGPISLCLDSFLCMYYFVYIACMCTKIV